MNIHEICRKKRREMEMTQSRLAEYAGTNQSTIANFESGRTGISSKTLDRIFNALGIDISSTV